MVAAARGSLVCSGGGGGVLPHFLACDAVLVTMIGLGCYFLITSNGWTLTTGSPGRRWPAAVFYGCSAFPSSSSTSPRSVARYTTPNRQLRPGWRLVPKLSNRDLKHMIAQQQASHGWFRLPAIPHRAVARSRASR